MKPLEKCFWEEAAEMVHVEGMLSKALFRMHSAAHAESLKELLGVYRVEVEKNLAQLTRTFRLFEIPVREKKNDTAIALLQKVQQTILRIGSGPLLDTLILALCRKIIALKTLSYATIANWAQSLDANEENLPEILDKLHRTEVEADSQFRRLVSKFDSAAAAQTLEPPRKREVVRSREVVRARDTW